MNLSLSWHYFDAGVSDLFLPPPRSICCIAALSFDDQKGGSFLGYIDPVRTYPTRALSSVPPPRCHIPTLETILVHRQEKVISKVSNQSKFVTACLRSELFF